MHQKGSHNSNYKDGKHCEQSLCECGGSKDYRASGCNRCSSNIDKYFSVCTKKRNHILWRYIKTFELIPHNKCLWCGIGDNWNGKSLVLQLDHIDGDTSNNDLTNLRVLCPNCHSQTETFASRNRRK
ncbi:hypothetical protein 16Q_022c [Pseudomonas phage 16Q]|nr:hypothetical protein 16Q_022c [Pseudomonas phage 16Q]